MIVLSNESKTRFDELHENYIQTFQPANAVNGSRRSNSRAQYVSAHLVMQTSPST